MLKEQVAGSGAEGGLKHLEGGTGGRRTASMIIAAGTLLAACGGSHDSPEVAGAKQKYGSYTLARQLTPVTTLRRLSP